MTLTIPTEELVGTIGDVIPFASPDKDDVLYHAVLLNWDGEHLSASATDRRGAGRSTWHPDDGPAGGEPAEDDMFSTWGSDSDGSESWTVHLPVPDAAELVKVFRLAARAGRTPLTVDVELKRLTVSRAADTGHSAITMRVDTDPDLARDFLDIRAELDTAESLRGPAEMVDVDARRLAALAKVRQFGPTRLVMCGEHGPNVWVAIGSRFCGMVSTVRDV